LYVFPDDNYKYVYRGDRKAKVTEESEKSFFAQNKNLPENPYRQLRTFYNDVVQRIKDSNQMLFVKSSQTNISDLVNLFFKQVDSNVHLIEGDTVSLFIPYDKEGEKTWEDYLQLFESDRTYRNFILIKEFRKKLIPYTINIFNAYIRGQGRKLHQVLKEEMQYGYYYCENWEKYYHLEEGLNQEAFRKETGGREFLFL
jgi:CRISPR-associated endonuclease/helicase Cas3